MSTNSDWDDESAIDERQCAERETDARICQLSAAWHDEHTKRARTIEKELTSSRDRIYADERLLLSLASNDYALAELLGHAEGRLAKMLLALGIDRVTSALAISRTLRQLGVCRQGATRRVQELSQAANVVRGQRQLAAVTPLRRVA